MGVERDPPERTPLGGSSMIRRSLVMLTAALSFGQVSFGVAIAAMPVSAAAQGQRVNTKALQAAAANAARAATKKALQDLDTQYELVKVRLDTASALASNLTQLVIVVECQRRSRKGA
jgi:hypothetical protein